MKIVFRFESYFTCIFEIFGMYLSFNYSVKMVLTLDKEIFVLLIRIQMKSFLKAFIR